VLLQGISDFGNLEFSGDNEKNQTQLDPTEIFSYSLNAFVAPNSYIDILTPL
jgi:hypothetical protein